MEDSCVDSSDGRASLQANLQPLDYTFAKLRPPPSLPAEERALGVGNGRHSLCEHLSHPDLGPQLALQLSSHGDIARLRLVSLSLRRVVDASPHLHLLGYLHRNVQLQPHQRADMQHMGRAESPAGWRFGQLRGGLLADEPGLGKTVTMIALILSTWGTLPKTPAGFWDE